MKNSQENDDMSVLLKDAWKTLYNGSCWFLSIQNVQIIALFFIMSESVCIFYFCGAGADEFLEKKLAPCHLSEADVGGDPESKQEGD